MVRIITLPPPPTEVPALPSIGVQLTGITLCAAQHPARRARHAVLLDARLAAHMLSMSVAAAPPSLRSSEEAPGTPCDKRCFWALLEPLETAEEVGTPAARRHARMQQPGTAAHAEARGGVMTVVVRADLGVEVDVSAQALQGGVRLHGLREGASQLRHVVRPQWEAHDVDLKETGDKDPPPVSPVQHATLHGCVLLRLPGGAAVQLHGPTSTWLLCQLGPVVAVAGTEPATTQRLASLHDVATPTRLPSLSSTPQAQLEGRQPSWQFSDADGTWRSCLSQGTLDAAPSTPSVRRVPSLPEGAPTQRAGWVGAEHVLVSVHSAEAGWVAQLLLVEGAETHMGRATAQGALDGVLLGHGASLHTFEGTLHLCSFPSVSLHFLVYLLIS